MELSPRRGIVIDPVWQHLMIIFVRPASNPRTRRFFSRLLAIVNQYLMQPHHSESILAAVL